MKKIFKNWNWFEIGFLFFSFATILVGFFIGTEKNYLSLITSLVGVLCVLLVAKGLIIAPFICIIFDVLYTILSITQKFYGEAIIMIFIMIPLCIVQIFSWLKNKNSKNKNLVSVSKVKPKEYILLFVIGVIGSIIFYFILKVLNTNELIVSTLSFTMSLCASYLSIRRSPYYAICYMIDDIVGFTLWLLAVVNFSPALIPSMLCPALYFINDIYGFYRWKKDEKQASNL